MKHGDIWWLGGYGRPKRQGRLSRWICDMVGSLFTGCLGQGNPQQKCPTTPSCCWHIITYHQIKSNSQILYGLPLFWFDKNFGDLGHCLIFYSQYYSVVTGLRCTMMHVLCWFILKSCDNTRALELPTWQASIFFQKFWPFCSISAMLILV